MFSLITDSAHYTTVLDLAMKAKHSLWIGTADIKFVGDSAQRCAFRRMVEWDQIVNDIERIIIPNEKNQKEN